MLSKKNSFLIFTFISLPLLILFILFQPSFPQSLDKQLPKGIAKIPLPKLLDFGAGKRIPCKKMAPLLQELSEEYMGRVVIKIIEVYDERELTRANGIQLIPTQIFFDSKNKEVFRHQGFMDKEEIKKIFDKMGVR